MNHASSVVDLENPIRYQLDLTFLIRKLLFTRAYGEVSTGTSERGTKNIQICKKLNLCHMYILGVEDRHIPTSTL